MPYPIHERGFSVSKILTNPSRKMCLLAVLSGVMLTASFPPAKAAWLSWFALIPLLNGVRKESPSRAFKLGFLAGVTHYLTLMYWILVVLEHYGGLNIVFSFAILGLFCIYLSLYPALFACLASTLRGFPFAACLLASLWVCLEFARAKLLTGFPWCLLGHSQYDCLELIQISGLVGVYGISFLIALSNVVLYVLLFDRPFEKKGVLKWELILALIMLSLTLTYGHLHLKGIQETEKGQEPVRTTIVQGNIDQSVKWHPAYQEKTIRAYDRLTRSSLSFAPDLVVWPETAVPFFFQDLSPLSHRIIALQREMGADLIFGSPAYRTGPEGTSYLNRAYCLPFDGGEASYYDKVHLVPFGEYVPMKKFLPFVQRLVPAAGDFISGKRPAPLKRPALTLGVLICFESIFPELARQQTRAGARVLVNLTNDAWFGMTSAPHQHLSMAVFRAVENRRPLIRAANTGISAFIDPGGKIIDRAGLFTEAVLSHEVKPSPPCQTLYTRYGDLFVMALSMISLVTVFYVLCYKKKLISRKSESNFSTPD